MNLITEQWQGEIHKNPMVNFSLKFKKLRKVLRAWNWNTFGDINRKEEETMEDIENLQKDQEKGWDSKNAENLIKAQSELENILWMKEAMAKDKARISWLKEGDRNSAFFHASIKARRVRNSFQLRRPDGSLTKDRDEIGKEAVAYYERLFNQYTPLLQWTRWILSLREFLR